MDHTRRVRFGDHVQLSRLADDHALATVTTRTEGARWGAVTLQLRAAGSRWHVADLQRLLAATHYRATAARDPGDPIGLAERIDRLHDQQRLVRAGLAATRRRLDELRGDPRVRDAVGHQEIYLKRALTELDRELADLRSRRDLSATVVQVSRS